MSKHSVVVLKFRIGRRKYEAVNCLGVSGKSSVSGRTMLRHAAEENGGAIGEDDVNYIKDSRRRQSLPRRLRGYELLTGLREPGNPRRVLGFIFEPLAHDTWNAFWFFLGNQMYRDTLVLRCRS